MILCQISDLHIKAKRELAYGVVDTAAMLERCVSSIVALPKRPDAVIATGDLVDGGQIDEYHLLRDLLAPLPMPVYLMPGNHDDRQALRQAFPDHDYLFRWEPFIQYVVESFPVRLIALDTLNHGEAAGVLCPVRLRWLERELSRSHRSTIVALHHPPFATGIGLMDQIALTNPSELAAIIARFRNVQRVISGHVHRPSQALFAGALASTCPSTAHQIPLRLASDSPSRFVLEPPAFQLHIGTESGLVTHTVLVDDFPGPFVFGRG